MLLVEDDPDTRDMYTLYLEFSGLGVMTASTGDEGFTLSLQHRPDIIVTDFMLRGYGTGADLCRRLRQDERTADIPVLVLTGSSRQADTEALFDSGCTQIKLKPYLPDELVNDIRQMVAEPRPQRQAG